MIDLEHIHIGDEVILRLPTGKKILGQVEGDEDTRFLKTPDGEDIYFARRINFLLEPPSWTNTENTVIGHIPSMFGGEW